MVKIRNISPRAILANLWIPRLHKSWIGLATLFTMAGLALVSCQDVTYEEEIEPQAPGTELPMVKLQGLVPSRIPDSCAWKTSKDSGREATVCEGTSCTVKFHLKSALGPDTLRLSLMRWGIRVGTVKVVAKPDGSGLTALGLVGTDSLVGKLLDAFALASSGNPDSIAKLGSDSRSRLVGFYASRLLAGDSAFVASPPVLPDGISRDALNAALVQVGARSSKSWTQIVMSGAGLDSAKVAALAQDAVDRGALQATDLANLQKASVGGAPVISVPSGSYDGPQEVEISCSVADCKLGISLDGSRWSPYLRPVQVDRTERVYARSIVTGEDPAITWADYTIALAPPRFTPAQGVSTTSRTVQILPSVPEATVYVSTDGLRWKVYERPIVVSVTTTLWAYDTMPGWARSPVVTAQYRVRTATPNIAPAGGTFPGAQRVSIADSVSEATIQYSFDSTEWLDYTGTVQVDHPVRLWARAWALGMDTSLVAATSFEFSLGEPKFSLPSGGFPSARKVGLSAASGVDIRYTTDGSDPSETSPLYRDSLDIARSMVVKAAAFKAGWVRSQVAMASYSINGSVATPEFSLLAGTYTSAKIVTLSVSTTGAQIRYTTDGTVPSDTSKVYKDPISVGATTTIRAIALKAGWATSLVAVSTYTITGTVARPSFSLPEGTYSKVQKVALSVATQGAEIRYTLDATTPDQTSPLYKDSIAIVAATTIKAIALKSDWETSPVASAKYALQDGFGMKLIPAGSFLMGSPSTEIGRAENEIRHSAQVSAFWMDTTHVTQGQYAALMGVNPSSSTGCGSDCPVETVTWFDAVLYCNARSKRDGFDTIYSYDGRKGTYGMATTALEGIVLRRGLQKPGYRLPTEAEWEYAARGTAARAGSYPAYSWGTASDPTTIGANAWYSANSLGKPHPVATKKPNDYGLYDMAGNVWHWVGDWHGTYPATLSVDYEGPATGSFKVRRGGSWDNPESFLRSAYRGGTNPDGRSTTYGFRCVRSSP